MCVVLVCEKTFACSHRLKGRKEYKLYVFELRVVRFDFCSGIFVGKYISEIHGQHKHTHTHRH